MQAAAPLMAVGSLVQGIGAFASGQANRRTAEINARQEIEQGNEAAGQVYSDARQTIGRQLGAQAESGFVPGTGSALDSLRESSINAELDALRARRKAASAALASQRQGMLAAREGTFGLASGLVGAASSIAGHKANYANMGAPYGNPDAIRVTV